MVEQGKKSPLSSLRAEQSQRITQNTRHLGYDRRGGKTPQNCQGKQLSPCPGSRSCVRAMWRAWHSWRFVYTNPCVEIPSSDDIPQGQPLMMNFLALFRGGEEEAGGTSQDSKFT